MEPAPAPGDSVEESRDVLPNCEARDAWTKVMPALLVTVIDPWVALTDSVDGVTTA